VTTCATTGSATPLATIQLAIKARTEGFTRHLSQHSNNHTVTFVHHTIYTQHTGGHVSTSAEGSQSLWHDAEPAAGSMHQLHWGSNITHCWHVCAKLQNWLAPGGVGIDVGVDVVVAAHGVFAEQSHGDDSSHGSYNNRSLITIQVLFFLFVFLQSNLFFLLLIGTIC